MPMSSRSAATLEVGILKDVGEQYASDKGLQRIEDVVQCLRDLVPGNIQKRSKKNRPTSGANQARHRDQEAANRTAS